MIGLVMALLAGLSFSSSAIFVRKGVYHSGESFTPIPISNFSGMILFGLATVISGNASQLLLASWTGIGYLAAAGALHFIVGRLFYYTGIRLIGANRSSPEETQMIGGL